MALSQNGWLANRRDLVSSRQVPGTNVRLTVRDGPAGDVLIYVAREFHRRVEPISNARGALDDWGYAERPIRGGTSLSNHASGTAIDLNATDHPLAVAGTFTRAQVREIRKILDEVGGVVRWGGDYRGRKDEMHFEINAGADAVARAAAALPDHTEEDDDMVPDGDRMKDVQEDLNWISARSTFELGAKLRVDGEWGPKTSGALDRFRKVWALRTRDARPNAADLSKIDRTIHEIKEHDGLYAA